MSSSAPFMCAAGITFIVNYTLRDLTSSPSTTEYIKNQKSVALKFFLNFSKIINAVNYQCTIKPQHLRVNGLHFPMIRFERRSKSDVGSFMPKCSCSKVLKNAAPARNRESVTATYVIFFFKSLSGLLRV